VVPPRSSPVVTPRGSPVVTPRGSAVVTLRGSPVVTPRGSAVIPPDLQDGQLVRKIHARSFLQGIMRWLFVHMDAWFLYSSNECLMRFYKVALYIFGVSVFLVSLSPPAPCLCACVHLPLVSSQKLHAK